MKKLAALTLLLLGACRPPIGVQAVRPPSGEDGARLEDAILRDLAAIDRRFAQRARIEPSEGARHRLAMSAVLLEDQTVAVVGGAIDPFSFDARGRALEAVRQKAGLLAGGTAPERQLLVRLVDAEALRLEEERQLPRSASALIQGVAETWTTPTSEREVADDDRWLAKRLHLVHESMAAPAPGCELDVVRARELDDALDAIERLSAGMVATTRALVGLREALEGAASRPAAKATSDWPRVERRLAVHLGVRRSGEALAKELAALALDLRVRAEGALAGAKIDRAALDEVYKRHVFVGEPCADAIAGSRVRSLAASPERSAGCHLRHLVAQADDDAQVALALGALHAHVVVAAWALDVSRGAATIAEAAARHRPLAPLTLETRARWERVALARPVGAIGAGLTAQLLLAGDPRARASAWSTRIGDVPLDVAERDLSP